MATLDIAAKGNPSLVYCTSILTEFLQQIGVLPDVTKAFHQKSVLGGEAGEAVVVLTTIDGSTFHDWDLLEHLPRLASDTVGFPTWSVVSSIIKEAYFVS